MLSASSRWPSHLSAVWIVAVKWQSPSCLIFLIEQPWPVTVTHYHVGNLNHNSIYLAYAPHYDMSAFTCIGVMEYRMRCDLHCFSPIRPYATTVCIPDRVALDGLWCLSWSKMSTGMIQWFAVVAGTLYMAGFQFFTSSQFPVTSSGKGSAGSVTERS